MDPSLLSQIPAPIFTAGGVGFFVGKALKFLAKLAATRGGSSDCGIETIGVTWRYYVPKEATERTKLLPLGVISIKSGLFVASTVVHG